MLHYIAIFTGGGLGSLCRFALSRYNTGTPTLFPFGTLAANVISCIILGFVVAMVSSKTLVHPNLRDFFTIGFCGGFSTFSTFSLETFVLLRGGYHGYVLAYIGVSVFSCLLALYAGFLLHKWMA